MNQVFPNFIGLIKHRLRPDLCGADLPESIDQEMAKKLMGLAQVHGLTAIIGSELVDQNLIPKDGLYQAIQKNACRAAVHQDKLDYDLQWICQELEKAQIPFMPLKGAVIQKHYPEPWLRTSCDLDILVHKEDLDQAVAVMQANHCTLHSEKGYHDISLVTPSGVLLELHFSIRENIAVMDRVLDRVWEHSGLVPGKQYEYCQTNSFLLVHLIAHMAYHCVAGGCGIRSFLDIWLLLDSMEYDKAAFQKLLQEAKLERFYANVLHILDVWFNQKKHTEATSRLEQIVVTGGAYGSADNKMLIALSQTGSKQKRFLNRIFMPYENLKIQFPVLEKHRWLTPVFQIVRWLRVFTGGRLRRAIGEYDACQSYSESQIKETMQFLKKVGLIFKE